MENSPSRPFAWSVKAEQAAALLAKRTMTLEEIAEQTSSSTRTLIRWQQNPEFVARVEEHRLAYREAVKAHGVADIVERVQRMDDHWNSLRAVIEERRAHYEALPDDDRDKAIPGVTTGLLLKKTKAVGTGADFQVVESWVTDTATLAELRQIEDTVAKHLGQVSTSVQMSGPGGTGIPIDVTVNQVYAQGLVVDAIRDFWEAFDACDLARLERKLEEEETG